VTDVRSRPVATAHPGAPVLALETATTRTVVVLGDLDGTIRAVAAWEAGHRHGEELLARVASILEDAGVGRPAPGRLAGVIVGTGPGGFTGLRVGLATARGIARAAAAPLVGIPTGTSLDAAARAAGVVPADAQAVVLLPAGPSGRYLVRDGQARLAPAEPLDAGVGGELLIIAVDLDGRAPADATERGTAARNGLAAALLDLGAASLRAGVDAGAEVGPEYVTMPRGVAQVAGKVEWSPARP
jgi:tRNA threonylcarbamoyl adenosine modification protein YeaZ